MREEGWGLVACEEEEEEEGMKVGKEKGGFAFSPMEIPPLQHLSRFANVFIEKMTIMN